ncbi:multiple sugar transport system permease protein [Thermocatellispora tengchongensis]|uniref:Multiple sugar transport system permease protein n=1 Tax=Thermocatellispora tengchongensis TaxID=1073253 RepID=A0A840P1K7_9ACTN|nr:carbohydrate ABC transporter permease [Thermocatellispora tengchongensis]MBB5133252.1 multiple sugar transport system permease protein [Thermocatellispora tengchongensis]
MTERAIISDVDLARPLVRHSMRIIRGAVFAGLLVAGAGPMLWLFKAATSDTQDTLRAPFSLWPSGVSWDNLIGAWPRLDMGVYLWNTVVMAAGSWASTLFVCVTGAYVLSVLRPRWGGVLSALVLATLFIPSVVSLVPLYLTVLDLPVTGGSLQNTWLAVWLPAAANAFNVIVIKRFFDALPKELFEAARADGAGPVRMLVSIVLPLSRPILGVVSLLTVVASWKEFLWPLLVLPEPTMQPLSVALPRVAQTSEISLLMAALFIAVLIPVALFLAFQKQFLRGVGLAGGIKG